MKLFRSITFVVIVILFYACSATKTVQKSEDKNVVTPTPMGTAVLQVDPHLQNGKTINLKLNDRFDVVFLRECIGCAEVWRVTAIDKNKIEQMESTYKNGPAPGVMGGGGSQDHIFHFTAKETGSSTLAFTYFKETSTITFDVK